jgi:hypothetical protein
MLRIEGDGFIKRKCLKSFQQDAKINTELFDILVELNDFSEELKKEFVVFRHDTPEEKQKVISMVVFIRLLEVIQSFIILASKGVREELHSLFRIFLDAYFVLANCCSAPDFIPTYFQSDERARLKILNSSLQYETELFKRTKEYALKERDALDKTVKDEKIQAFNSFAYAKNVGCEEIYDSLYRIKSASIHTSPRCLDHYVEVDPKGNIILIKHHSDPEETDRCVYDISYFFIKAISGICELFSLNYEKRVNDFNSRLERAASALDETQQQL